MGAMVLTTGIEENYMAYSETQIATMRDRAPLNAAICGELAGDFGTTQRSVISKAISLGITYEKKAKATKKDKTNEPTVVEMANQIRAIVGLPERDGGIVKADLEGILAHLS